MKRPVGNLSVANVFDHLASGRLQGLAGVHRVGTKERLDGLPVAETRVETLIRILLFQGRTWDVTSARMGRGIHFHQKVVHIWVTIGMLTRNDIPNAPTVHNIKSFLSNS